VSRLLLYPIAAIALFFLALGGAFAYPAQAGQAVAAEAGVNFKCTIVGDAGDPPRTAWVIELLSAAGVPLRQAWRLAGDTVHFRNLKPGIYRILLSGRQGRKRTESIDLTPPDGAGEHTFAKEVRVPSPPHEPGAHAVSLQQLAVPVAAIEQLKRARQQQLDGNEEKMVVHLKQAINLHESFAEAWNDLGAYYHRGRDYEQATLIFSKVTRMDPGLAAGWCNLGGTLLSTRDFKQAVEINQTALSLAPDDAIVASQLALSHYYLHNFEEAKKYFRLAFKLDPALSNAPQLFLAHLAMAENSFDEAKTYFKSYLTYHPNLPAAAGVRQILEHLAAGTLITQPAVKR